MPAAIKGTITVDGQQISITNPDKPLWPEMGITKQIYLQKLAALSPTCCAIARTGCSR